MLFIQSRTPPSFIKILGRDRSQMKDNMISLITYLFDFVISTHGVLDNPRCTICKQNDFKGFPNTPRGKIKKISFVRNHDIFHLRPVPSKNIEKWERS